MGNENAKEGEMPRTTSSVNEGQLQRSESSTSRDAVKKDLLAQQEKEKEERDKKKKSKRATAAKITFVQKAEFYDLFCGLDLDEDGFISEQQLADALRALGMRCRPRDMKRIQKEFDADKNGKYNFPEFLEIMAAQMRELDIEKFNQGCPASGITEEDITREQVVYFKHLYTYFDSDSAGEIDANDLKELLKSLGKVVTMDEVNKIIATASSTKFTLTFYEFLNVIIAMGIPDDVIVTEEQAGTLSRRRTVSGREKALIKISKSMQNSAPTANTGDYEDEVETKSSISKKPRKTVRHKSAKSRKGDDSSCDESTECSSTVLSDRGSNMEPKRSIATSHIEERKENIEGRSARDEKRQVSDDRGQDRARPKDDRRSVAKVEEERDGPRGGELPRYGGDSQRWSDEYRRNEDRSSYDRSSRDYPPRLPDDIRQQMQMFQSQLAGIISHIAQNQPIDQGNIQTARPMYPRDSWVSNNQVPPIHSTNNGFYSARIPSDKGPIRQQTVFDNHEDVKGRASFADSQRSPPVSSTMRYVAPKIPEKKHLPHIERAQQPELSPASSSTSEGAELAMRCKTLVTQVKESSDDLMRRELDESRKRSDDRVRVSPTESHGKYIPPSIPTRAKPQKSFVVNADPTTSPSDDSIRVNDDRSKSINDLRGARPNPPQGKPNMSRSVVSSGDLSPNRRRIPTST